MFRPKDKCPLWKQTYALRDSAPHSSVRALGAEQSQPIGRLQRSLAAGRKSPGPTGGADKASAHREAACVRTQRLDGQALGSLGVWEWLECLSREFL